MELKYMRTAKATPEDIELTSMINFKSHIQKARDGKSRLLVRSGSSNTIAILTALETIGYETFYITEDKAHIVIDSFRYK